VLVETHYRKQLGLKVHRVTRVEVTEESVVVCIDRLGRRLLRCSVCHRRCQKVHGLGRQREWRDLAFRDLPLRLRYRPRRVDSLGVPEDHIDSLLNDYEHAGLLAPDLALLEFCLKLSRDSPSVGPEDLEALRARGLEDEAIVEAVVLTALAVYRCTLSAALRPEPDVRPRNLCPKIFRGADEAVTPTVAADTKRKAARRGQYVHAPYLSPITFEHFAIVLKSHGFIPNFFRAQTLRPDLLQAQLDAVGSILLPEDVLTRVQKESILLAVSAANLNSYCVAVHCNLLRGLGFSAEEADQIAVDYRLSTLSKADMALLDFAVKLGTRSSEYSPEDAGKLASFGFTQEQILEGAVVTALNNFANTLQMGLGIEPDFERPSSFEKNRVNLSEVATTLPREGEVHLVETSQDADAELVAQAQCGNLEAFEELVRRHTQLIYRVLIAILGGAADAQDVMQDTLLSAFRHIGGFQGRSKFSTWLVSIARHPAVQRLQPARQPSSLCRSSPPANPYRDSSRFLRQLRWSAFNVVRLADNTPLSFDETYLPRQIGEKIMENHLETEPIFSLLEQKYDRPTSGSRVLS